MQCLVIRQADEGSLWCVDAELVPHVIGMACTSSNRVLELGLPGADVTDCLASDRLRA